MGLKTRYEINVVSHRDLIHDHVFCKVCNPQAAAAAAAGKGLCDQHVCQSGMLFAGHEEKWAQLAWTIFRIIFWVGVAGVLHRRRWYWAL